MSVALMQHLDAGQVALPVAAAAEASETNMLTTQQSSRCILALLMLKIAESSPHAQWLRAPGCSNRSMSHVGGEGEGPVGVHAHTRRRLRSALTTSQVGAGVAPVSRPEFITCAHPVWPGWYVQPASSSEYMPDLVKLMPSALTTSLQRATEEAADVIAPRLHAWAEPEGESLCAQAVVQLSPPSARKYCGGGGEGAAPTLSSTQTAASHLSRRVPVMLVVIVMCTVVLRRGGWGEECCVLVVVVFEALPEVHAHVQVI